MHCYSAMVTCFFFFFNDTATTEIYTYCHTLSLHDALPICASRALVSRPSSAARTAGQVGGAMLIPGPKPVAALGKAGPAVRSEEHTSELQSLMRISYAVFCLKKKKKK